MRFRMTASDYEVLRTVAECRIVTVPQLAALPSRNGKSMSQRIGQLAAEGLLAHAARGPGQHRGRPERVISLTEHGLQALREREVVDAKMPTETVVSDAVPSQAHQLLLNWVRVHLHHVQAVIAHLKIQFLAHNSPFLPPGFSNLSVVTNPQSGRAEPQRIITLTPDAAFVIRDMAQAKAVLFFLEVDRGTETLASPKRESTDIRQKILNYGMCFDAGAYKKYESLWNCELNGFRLLFVTDSVARLSTLCSLIQAMPPSDYIWLTNKDRMFEDGISAEIWARGGRLDVSPQSILGRFRRRALLP
jgi:hypothetical protein